MNIWINFNPFHINGDETKNCMSKSIFKKTYIELLMHGHQTHDFFVIPSGIEIEFITKGGDTSEANEKILSKIYNNLSTYKCGQIINNVSFNCSYLMGPLIIFKNISFLSNFIKFLSNCTYEYDKLLELNLKQCIKDLLYGTDDYELRKVLIMKNEEIISYIDSNEEFKKDF